MNASDKKPAASMNERNGGIIDWLAGMDRARIPALMDQLREEMGQTNNRQTLPIHHGSDIPDLPTDLLAN
jgi:hypothetical protein